MQRYLQKVVNRCHEYCDRGQVAQYIPKLSEACSTDLGVAVLDINGKLFYAGNYDKKFTIQSISKPLVLILALMDHGQEYVFSRVGKEPTGDPFNSIIKLETFNERKPLNPMINAGAISVTSMINGDNNEQKFERMMDLLRKLSKNPDLSYNTEVYKSEKATGDRNRAMAYFLKDLGNIEGDVEEILDLYFKQCSIEMTCIDLANVGVILANEGIDYETGEQIIPKKISKIVKTFMVTCGMYDASGAFAIDVGIPSKSGVGGGILSSVPGKMGIGVYGPSLNNKGNSVAGVEVLKQISMDYNLSLF